MSSLKNFHILVTGAGSGIGRQVCSDLAEREAFVSALDVDEKALRRLSSELPSVNVMRADVTQTSEIESALCQAEKVHGPLYGLVHAAGRLTPGSLLEAAMTVEHFRETIRINLEGTWNIARAVALRLRERKNGSIVLISSNAGTTPRVKLGAYCASKAGATMVMHCLALELGSCGVRCNGVSPGSTDTPMLNGMLKGDDFAPVIAGDLSTYRVGIPLGRVATPSDVSNAALFLLGPESRHITGHDLRVDGGATWS